MNVTFLHDHTHAGTYYPRHTRAELPDELARRLIDLGAAMATAKLPEGFTADGAPPAPVRPRRAKRNCPDCAV